MDRKLSRHLTSANVAFTVSLHQCKRWTTLTDALARPDRLAASDRKAALQAISVGRRRPPLDRSTARSGHPGVGWVRLRPMGLMVRLAVRGTGAAHRENNR